MSVQTVVLELQQNPVASLVNMVPKQSSVSWSVHAYVDSENMFHKILSVFKFIIYHLSAFKKNQTTDYVQNSSQYGKFLKALDLVINFILFSTRLFS